MKIELVKVDDNELQKKINKIARQLVKKQTDAGSKLLEETSKSAIEDWYGEYGNKDHDYSSIEGSVKVKKGRVHVTSKIIWLDYEVYVDEGLYSYYTSHYNLYHYKDAKKVSDPLGLTLGAQWSNGIIGLPASDRNGKGWPHITAREPLSEAVKLKIQKEWNMDSLKKYM